MQPFLSPSACPPQPVTQVTHQTSLSVLEGGKHMIQTTQRLCPFPLHFTASHLFPAYVPSALPRVHLEYQGPEVPSKYEGISWSLEQTGDLESGGHPSPSPRRHIHCPQPKRTQVMSVPAWPLLLVWSHQMGKTNDKQPSIPSPHTSSSCLWDIRNFPEILGCSWHKNAGESKTEQKRQ